MLTVSLENQNIDNFLDNIKTTEEYFNLTLDKLLKIKNEYGYTKEECLLFDDGIYITFFDSEKELKKEKQEFETYIKSENFEIKSIVKTINERLAVILI